MTDNERYNAWWEANKDHTNCEYCSEKFNCPSAYEDTPACDAPCTEDPEALLIKEDILKDLSKEDAWE